MAPPPSYPAKPLQFTHASTPPTRGTYLGLGGGGAGEGGLGGVGGGNGGLGGLGGGGDGRGGGEGGGDGKGGVVEAGSAMAHTVELAPPSMEDEYETSP